MWELADDEHRSVRFGYGRAFDGWTRCGRRTGRAWRGDAA